MDKYMHLFGPFCELEVETYDWQKLLLLQEFKSKFTKAHRRYIGHG